MMNFRKKTKIPENDDTFFYGAAFDDFNKEWQGADTLPDQVKDIPAPSEYRKLPLTKRAKLLPPPSDNRMEEFSRYQERMGYTAEEMKSIRYKMSVYDDFNDEHDARLKCAKEHPSEEQFHEQDKEQIVIPVHRRGRGR
ncbi:MAG: hypothetical protein RSD28_09375 [Lachnospiraceae bacterium]